MQAEQQTTTLQNKKPNSKGGKKNVKNEVAPVVNEVIENNQTVVAPQPVIEVAAPVVVENLVQTEQVNNDVENDNELEFQTVLDFMNNASDRFMDYSKLYKDRELTKDDRSKLEGAFKKLNKAYSSFQTGYTENLSRQVSVLEKKSGNKSVKKSMADKEKAAIHKKLKVQKFLLDFMKLPADTLVSRSEALTAITGYVKEQKAHNPDIIVENDKKQFKIVGELQQLFTGIKGAMDKKGLNEEMPKQIRYTQIMTYMSHCFIKDETA